MKEPFRKEGDAGLDSMQPLLCVAAVDGFVFSRIRSVSDTISDDYLTQQPEEDGFAWG